MAEARSSRRPTRSPLSVETAFAFTGMAKNDSVGPGQYSPTTKLTKPDAPNFSFGTAHRFLPAKLTYISPLHTQDLVGHASPGYVYDTSRDPTKPRTRSLSFGNRADLEAKLARDRRLVRPEQEIGPGTYHPKVDLVKRTSPRAAFSHADRFSEKNPMGLYGQAIWDNKPGPDYHANHDLVKQRSPSFSFASPLRSPPGGSPKSRDLDGSPKSARTARPETKYKDAIDSRGGHYTWNLAGGLARPATVDGHLGPGKYSPDKSVVERTAPSWGFGGAGRFSGAGAEFISDKQSQAAFTPGPGFYNIRSSIGAQARTKQPRRAGLKWTP